MGGYLSINSNTNKPYEYEFYKTNIHNVKSNMSYSNNYIVIYTNNKYYVTYFDIRENTIYIEINNNTFIINYNSELEMFQNKLNILKIIRNDKNNFYIPNGLNKPTIGVYSIRDMIEGKLRLIRNINGTIKFNYDNTDNYYDLKDYMKRLICIDSIKYQDKKYRYKCGVKIDIDNNINNKITINTIVFDKIIRSEELIIDNDIINDNNNSKLLHCDISNKLLVIENDNNTYVTIIDIEKYGFIGYLEYVYNKFYRIIESKYQYNETNHNTNKINKLTIIDLHSQITYDIDNELNLESIFDDDINNTKIIRVATTANRSFEGNCRKSFYILQDILLNRDIKDTYPELFKNNCDYSVHDMIDHICCYIKIFNFNEDDILYISYRLLHLFCMYMFQRSFDINSGKDINKINKSIQTKIIKLFYYNFEPYSEIIDRILRF